MIHEEFREDLPEKPASFASGDETEIDDADGDDKQRKNSMKKRFRLRELGLLKWIPCKDITSSLLYIYFI